MFDPYKSQHKVFDWRALAVIALFVLSLVFLLYVILITDRVNLG